MGWGRGEPVNIGWHLTDRICRLGLARKPALLWEALRRAREDVHLRRLAPPLERRRRRPLAPRPRALRADLPLPRPRAGALHRFRRDPQDGRVVQPLFSAFGEESLLTRLLDAGTAAVVTQRKHLPKVRRIRPKLPALRTVVVVDAQGLALRTARSRSTSIPSRASQKFHVFPATARDAVGPPLHVRNDRAAEGRAARPPLARLAVPDGEVGARPQARRRLLVQRRPRLGDRDVVRDHRPLVERRHAGRSRLGLRSRPLVRLHREAADQRLVLRPDGDPPPDAGGRRDRAKRHDLSSLRHLASVGEPLNPEAVHWSREAFGLPFHDTYWQTETGCIVISNYPGMPVKPGSMGKPFPGIAAAVLDPATLAPYDGAGARRA